MRRIRSTVHLVFFGKVFANEASAQVAKELRNGCENAPSPWPEKFPSSFWIPGIVEENAKNPFCQQYRIESVIERGQASAVKLPEFGIPALQRGLSEKVKVFPLGIFQTMLVLALRKIVPAMSCEKSQTGEQQKLEGTDLRKNRLIVAPRIGQDLMDEPKVPSPQQLKAHMRILERRVTFLVKRISRTHQFRTQEQRRGRTEKIDVVQEVEPTDVPARHFQTG